MAAELYYILNFNHIQFQLKPVVPPSKLNLYYVALANVDFLCVIDNTGNCKLSAKA